MSQQWDYAILYKDVSQNREMEQSLVKAGENGWELVSTAMERRFPDDGAITLFLKRPRG